MEALPSGTTLPRGSAWRLSQERSTLPSQRARVLGLGTVLSANRYWFTACLLSRLSSHSRMQKRVSGNTNCYASFAASAGPGRSGEEASGCKTTFFFCAFFFLPSCLAFLVLTAQAEETTNQILKSRRHPATAEIVDCRP